MREKEREGRRREGERQKERDKERAGSLESGLSGSSLVRGYFLVS